MSKVHIDDQLAVIVAKMSKLRIATPIKDPHYKKITKQYREVSDCQTEAIDKAIDDADKNYQAFSKQIKIAIEAIDDALENIKKITTAIEKVAKLIGILGKIFKEVAKVL